MKNTNSRYKTLSTIKVVEERNSWWRLAIIVLIFLGILAALSFYTHQLGGFVNSTSRDEEQLLKLTQQVEKSSGQVSSSTNTVDSELNIERATQKQLAIQVQTLTKENNKLKEDLAFFENLMPAVNGPKGVRIGAFKANARDQSQIQYRLLVMQGGKNVPEFQGELQFVATVTQNGKTISLTFPEAKSGEAGKLKLAFKYYQRMEGTLPLPEGTTVKTLQARILNRGQLRTFQSINL